QHLRDRPGGLPPPHLELEKPIPRRGVALREEQIVLGLCVDVVDAPSVADDLDRLGEPFGPHRRRRRLRVPAETPGQRGRRQYYDEQRDCPRVHRAAPCLPEGERGISDRNILREMRIAPEYVSNVLHDNFEDAKELLLTPLMSTHYAHLVMLVEQRII